MRHCVGCHSCWRRRRFWSSLCAVVGRVRRLEKIISFDSEIWIQKNGSLSVRETITVQAEGNQIKRGIYRDFPTVYTSKRGVRTTTTFNVVEVPPRRPAGKLVHRGPEQRGPALYRPQGGDAQTRALCLRDHLHHGSPTRTFRRLRRTLLERHRQRLGVRDWTGFTAKIHLPDGAKVLEHAGYTGAFGETRPGLYVQPGVRQPRSGSRPTASCAPMKGA